MTLFLGLLSGDAGVLFFYLFEDLKIVEEATDERVALTELENCFETVDEIPAGVVYKFLSPLLRCFLSFPPYLPLI